MSKKILVCCPVAWDDVANMENIETEISCADCARPIYIGKQGSIEMRRDPNMWPVCMPCAIANHGLRGESPITELKSGVVKSLDGSLQ